MRFSTEWLAVVAMSVVVGMVQPAPAAAREVEPDQRAIATLSPELAPVLQKQSASPQVEPLPSSDSLPPAMSTPERLIEPASLSSVPLSSETVETSATEAMPTEAGTAQTRLVDAIATVPAPSATPGMTGAESLNLVAIDPLLDEAALTDPMPAEAASFDLSNENPVLESPLTPAGLLLAQEVPPSAPAPSLGTPTPAPAEPEPEPRVLVSEVVVEGAGDLEDEVYEAISTFPGQTTTRTQLQQDINAVFATGFFANVSAVPQDTPLGVRITFVVEPNPTLTRVQVLESQVLPQEVVDDIFGNQYGSTLNLNQFQAGVNGLNSWYRNNGYVLAQIIEAPNVGPDGVVTLVVAEGVIEDIQVRFLDGEGEATDEDGEPIRGRTREFIITREFETQPGDVFNQPQIEQDLRSAFQLGIFEDLQVTLSPGTDPRQVNVVVNAIEGQSGSIGASVGLSSASGLFGSVSYQERNLGGNNQRLSAEVQVGQRDLLFDLSFSDPWIAGDPFRTSYTVNAFGRRSIPLVFQGGETEVFLPEGDRPRLRRLGGGITFNRPLDNGWRAGLGLQYQNIRVQDFDGGVAPVDELGNQLSFSGSGVDDLLLVQLSASQDRRNDPLAPTSGTFLRVSTEQSVPIGQGSIFLNRLRGSYSFFLPTDFTSFDEGPETLAFNLQGGVVLGDLPPYEAFTLGGSDSIRGYDAGDVASGRAFVLGSVEYRFPLFAIVGGALFVDVGSDLGTSGSVIGDPAGARGKPGFGLGYGVGVRVRSPIGPIRIDYGFNDQGDSRIHFGIGERF